MIEEQYVSLETAQLLKETGFDVPCLSCYSLYGGSITVWQDQEPHNQNECKFYYSRPTQALAARWLREVHKLHVFADCDTFSGFYVYTIRRTYKVDEIKTSDLQYPSYERAIEEGLCKAIKLIEK